MSKHLVAIPARPANNLDYFSVHREKTKNRKSWWTFSWLFGDSDYRWGKQDVRKAPSVWSESLHGIEKEEERDKDKIDSWLKQNISGARSTLDLFPPLHDQNKAQIDVMAAQGGMLPEVEAKNLKSSARWTRMFANFLLVVEVCSLFAVAKTTFGNGLIGPLTLAILFVAIIAVLTGLALGKASDKYKGWIFWTFISVGMLLAITGMVGFAILRASTFNASLMGGTINYGQVSLGNALLMIGLTLGVPLIIGALHHDASVKKTKADNSMDLYDDRMELQKCESEWNQLLVKLEGYEKKMDALTQSIIRDRKSSYRQGFHRGSPGNPAAAPFLKELVAAGK